MVRAEEGRVERLLHAKREVVADYPPRIAVLEDDRLSLVVAGKLALELLMSFRRRGAECGAQLFGIRGEPRFCFPALVRTQRLQAVLDGRTGTLSRAGC